MVVSTPTASGKSLCYNLPVLDALARDGAARALYLFPTKALARDQEEALKALMREAKLEHGAVTYDGDTPGDARRAARERSGILLTNPDMLHAGILPHHANWARLFANLRYVVIDELHTYRGVFGSHLANVLRRLLAHRGVPRLEAGAAVRVGHHRQPARARRAHGWPRGRARGRERRAHRAAQRAASTTRRSSNAELGIRQSYLKAAVRITADLVRAEVPTLVFGQGRNQVETMLKYLRDRLARDKLDPEQIVSYRGGYLPETRRRIEAGLREGADPLRGRHQRARAGHRHRLARCGGVRRLSGQHRGALAALWARGPASGGLAGGAGRLERAARPVLRDRSAAPSSARPSSMRASIPTTWRSCCST